MAPRDMHHTVKKDWDERSKTAVDTSPLAGLNCRYGSYHLVTYYCELLQFVFTLRWGLMMATVSCRFLSYYIAIALF